MWSSALYRKSRCLTQGSGHSWMGYLPKIKVPKSCSGLNICLWKILEVDMDWSVTWILSTCDLHEPKFCSVDVIWIFQTRGLSEVFLSEKKKKSPFFHLMVSEDREILMCLGNLFHCLNTLAANSVCLASHLIFPDLNYIHWFLLWPTFPRQKSHLIASDFLQEYICVLWSSHISGFFLKKETDQAHCESFFPL